MTKRGGSGVRRDGNGRLVIDVRWRDPETGAWKRYRERAKVGATRAAAEERARVILNAALVGTFDPRRRPDAERRLRASLDAYLDWLGTERPKSVRDRSLHANALVREIGDVGLEALTALHVERFKKLRRDAGAAPGTINRHLATLKHFARKAAEWGWMPADVASSVRTVHLLREPPGRVRYLDRAEETRLFEALPSELRAVALAADLSGMRRSEVVGLRWSSVDLAHRVITLVRTKSNRVRRIPVHDDLARLLEAQRRGEGPDAYVFALPTTPNDSRRVKRSEDHRRREYVTKAFRRACETAKIDDLRFHDLRHDFATRLRRGGAGIDAIAKVLGHAQVTTATRYAHVEDATLRDAVRAMTPPGGEPTEGNVLAFEARRR